MPLPQKTGSKMLCIPVWYPEEALAPTVNADACNKTTNGNGGGAGCVYPLSYKGAFYISCTNAQRPGLPKVRGGS